MCGESHHRRHCPACAHDCRDLIYEYMMHFRFIKVLEVCVCVCVCVCVNARGCKEHKTTLKDLPIMHHAFIRQSCGHYVSIAHVGRTVASAGGGGGGIIRARRISELMKLYLQRRGWLIHRHHDYLLFLDHNFIRAPRCPQRIKSKLFGTFNFQNDLFRDT